MRSVLSIMLAVLLLAVGTITVNSSGVQAEDLPPSSVPDGVPQAAPDIEPMVGGGGGLYYKTYSPTEFKTRDQADAYLFSAFYYYSTTAGADFVMPINLPQGANLTEIKYYFWDSDASYDIYMWFVRINSSAGTYSDLVSLAPAVNTAAISTTTQTGAPITVIDNLTYAYQLQFRVNSASSTHRLYGARVGYTLP